MNFGHIKLAYDFWEIACEPHVKIKLKRLFPQIKQRAAEVISLSDTIENCRDLIWFIERYPMTLSAEHKSYLHDRAIAHVELENKIDALLSMRIPPAAFTLAEPARDYQMVAATLATINRGTLVADSMGLGKTVTSICLMAEPENLITLVVTMTHLTGQWEREINRFAPNLKTHILKKAQPYDLVKATTNKLVPDRLPDVIICNYSKLHGWAETLSGLVRCVIFDEAQELRRPDSNKYAAAKYVAKNKRVVMGLSGTPIYNMGIEFFHVIDVIRPGALGTKDEFVREWCADEYKIKDTKAFGSYLRHTGLMIRRTVKDVNRELPPIIKIPQYVDCDEYYLHQIQSSAVDLAKTILSNQQLSVGTAMQAHQEFNVLMRQATGIAKAPFVADFVRMLLETEEKIVLFGWHREVYNIWLERLKDFNPRLYTGSESTAQKEAAAKAFTDGDCRVLIISLRSGAGLDGLQKVCSVIVKGELDYSPAVHDQCNARVARDGQENTVMVHYLISESGSDPVIAEILGVKRGQIEGVINPDGDLIEELTVDPGYIKRLASDYLARLGVELPVNTAKTLEKKSQKQIMESAA